MTNEQAPIRYVKATIAAVEASETREGLNGQVTVYPLILDHGPFESKFPYKARINNGCYKGQIVAGTEIEVCFQRGKLKRDKTGEWDSDYWWNAIPVSQWPEVPPAQVESQPQPGNPQPPMASGQNVDPYTERERATRRSIERQKAAELALAYDALVEGDFEERASRIYAWISAPQAHMAPAEAPSAPAGSKTPVQAQSGKDGAKTAAGGQTRGKQWQRMHDKAWSLAVSLGMETPEKMAFFQASENLKVDGSLQTLSDSDLVTLGQALSKAVEQRKAEIEAMITGDERDGE